MPLSSILEYQTFSLPAEVNRLSLKSLPSIETEIKAEINRIKGTPTALLHKNLPSWYYVLLFKHLYPSAPEIILEVASNVYLVLHTIYQGGEYARPESVHLFSDLLPHASDSSDAPLKEYSIDLSALPKASSSDIASVIATVQAQIHDADTVYLTGDADPVPSLICFVLCRQRAQRVMYISGSQRIVLS